MAFKGVVELLHLFGGSTVHKVEMLLHEGIHIGILVPEDFSENVKVHGVEDPEIQLRLKEGAEAVGSGLFIEAAHGAGGETGDIGDAVADLGDVVPEIGLGIEFFLPCGKEFDIPLLDGGVVLFPGAGQRQLDDDVGAEIHGGDGTGGAVSHHGAVSGDTFLQELAGDVAFEFPDVVAGCLFSGFGVSFGIVFQTRLHAAGAAAGIEGVVGHDVEKGTAEIVGTPFRDPP